MPESFKTIMPQLHTTAGILADPVACNVKTCCDEALLEPPGRAPGPQVTSAEQRWAAKEPSGGSATGLGQSGAAGSEGRIQANAGTFTSQGTEGGLGADH